MPPKRQPYMCQGKRVPGVTTILSKFKDPGALMYWSWDTAYSQLREAVHLLEKPSPKAIKDFLSREPLEAGNYRKESADAASAGTLAHDLVEQWIHANKGEKQSLSKQTPTQLKKIVKQDLSICENATRAFHGFLEWADAYKFQPKFTEARLVSTQYRFGGTIDCGGTVGTGKNKTYVLLDWKTSKALYSDYLLQIAAYGILWCENRKEELDSFHLVRFAKDTGDYHHHHFRELDDAEQCFLHLRECYDLIKLVEKRTK